MGRERYTLTFTPANEERLAAFVSLALSGAATLRVPRFPPGCVCCGAEPAAPRPAAVGDPQMAVVEPILVPACADCSEHYARSAGVLPILVTVALLVGAIAALALAWWTRGARLPDDAAGWWWWLLPAGACFLGMVGSLVFIDRDVDHGEGHTGPVGIGSVASQGMVVVNTPSTVLRDALVELNEGAFEVTVKTIRPLL